MANQSIIRGSTVLFEAKFYDARGVQVQPASADVTLHSAWSGKMAPIVLSQQNDGTWTAEWDSSGATHGLIYWTIKSVGPSAVQNGIINLIANISGS